MYRRLSALTMKRIAVLQALFLCGGCTLLAFTLCIYSCITPTGTHPKETRVSNTKPEEIVEKKPAFLVVVITSKPTNVLQRTVIRQTWLKQIPDEVIIYFVIGLKDLKKDELSLLNSESKRFRDVLLLEEIYDSYLTLSSKILASYTWISNHIDFKFLLKTDDDSFVRLEDISEELNTLPEFERYYWGFFDGRAHAHRSGQWKEEDWFLCEHYLPYALGGGYVISYDLVNFIAQSGPLLKLYKSEDVSVGTWLAGLDIQRVHDPRFDTEYKSRGCSNTYLVTHKQSVDQMREKYRQLQNNGQLCAQEYQDRLSYKYNWDVKPALCCIRNDSSVP